jgi:hypothetical protein
MPIVSQITETTVQANGSTSNVVRLYDQDGREYMQSFFAPAGFDVQGKVTAMIAEMDEQLAQAEFETLVGSA